MMVHFSVSIFKNQEGNETILETKGMMLIKKYTHSNIYLYHLYNGAHHSNIKRYKVKKMNRKIAVILLQYNQRSHPIRNCFHTNSELCSSDDGTLRF